MNLEDRISEYSLEDLVNAVVVMRIQEDTSYRCSKYLNSKVKLGVQVNESCRTKMAKWCFQVSDFCKFSYETVGIGMSYLDRLLCTPQGQYLLNDRKSFQLAAMCTLYISIKMFEPRHMGIDLMAELSRGCYSETEIANMEKMILDALKWRMNPPTPERFVREFLRLLESSTIQSDTVTAISDICQLQISLAVKEWDFVGSKPSMIAIASILNSMEFINRSHLCPSIKMGFVSQLRQIYVTSMHSPETKQIRQMLLFCISQSPSTKAAIQQNTFAIDAPKQNSIVQNYRAMSPVGVNI